MSSSSTSRQWKYDVFVSFRGDDVRKTFKPHLFKRLKEEKLIYFNDNDAKDTGKKIDSKIFKAIHDARVALVVLSAKYADSMWCLRELVEILKCSQETSKMVVIPVFHGVQTSHVSNLTGDFGKAFKELCEKVNDDEQTKVWSKALSDVKNIAGFDLNNYRDEPELIKAIVERLVEEIPSSSAIPRTCSVEDFGPFGGEGGKSWTSGDVKGIVIHFENFIKSITFEVNGATSFDFEPQTDYGGNGRENTFKVMLKNEEHINSFSGYVKNATGEKATLINSLTFRTNKGRKWGPFGSEEGDYFFLPSEVGKVISFFGTNGDHLESIGARVELFTNNLYPFKSVGLFGCSDGSPWDDGNDHTGIREILVEVEQGNGKCIRSITFRYEKNGQPCLSKRRGGAQGKGVDPIKIDTDEYLTSMSGYHTKVGITSLTFQTNKKTIEATPSLKLRTEKKTVQPIGDEKVRHFSSPAMGGKIVGFYGRSGENLKAIGAHFEPILDLYPIKSIGPFGCPGETAWGDKTSDGVRKISLMHNPNIHHIMFEYDKNGQGSWSAGYGRPGKGLFAKQETIKLDYPQEYLTSISGYMQEDGATIQSLTFYSNRRRLGPYGKEEGKYFWYPSTGSKIIGFYGTCGKTLNSIGAYAKPTLQRHPFKTVGPFGGYHGTSWDDGLHTDVRGFCISFGDRIHSIRVAYDDDGSFKLEPEHGERDHKYEEHELDYPRDRLRSISVWLDTDGNTVQPIIRDLKIVTAKTHYGPFVLKSQSERDKLKALFIPPAPNGGKIVGFFGWAGQHLNSLGARLET